MKKVLLGGVALITLGLVGSASAADMPVKAPVVVTNTWDGFYLGVNAGAGFLQDSMSFTQDPSCNLAAPGCVNNTSFDPVSYNGRNWGFAGGLHGGYNFALPAGWLTPGYGSGWVIGVEADWNKTEVGNGGGQVGLDLRRSPRSAVLPDRGCPQCGLLPRLADVRQSQLDGVGSRQARLDARQPDAVRHRRYRLGEP
jgi:opacity protein-like surface antigen